MSSEIWRYRSEARGHVWELIEMGYDRPDDLKLLHASILHDPENFLNWLINNSQQIANFVQATPSRRTAILKQKSMKDSPITQVAMILGAYQIARKAVISFTHEMYEDNRFRAGDPYRVATVRQSNVYDIT